MKCLLAHPKKVFALSVAVTFLFVSLPLVASAQVCTGVCINVTTGGSPTSGGSTGGSNISPSNEVVSLQDGASCTSSRSIDIHLEFSNVDDILISEESDPTLNSWQPIEGEIDHRQIRRGENGEIIETAVVPWVLSEGDELKEVFVRFRSQTDIQSRTFSDTIMLDVAENCVDAPTIPDDPVAALLTEGDFVKTASLPGVYYINAEGERRPFYNEAIFYTYSSTFDVVKEISEETLSNIPIGAPMTPKPGTVLVKWPDSPRVYYVGANVDPDFGMIRWIVSEPVAEANFGDDWLRYVIDLPVSLRPRFTEGDQISDFEGFELSNLIVSIQLTGDKFSADSDQDGLSDYLESTFGTDPFEPDADGDRLLDGDEFFYATDPLGADTDGDGQLDGDEVNAGFNPKGDGVLDSDGDGLLDHQEKLYGTDRSNADSDGDGYLDGVEVNHGFNPLGSGLQSRNVTGFGIARYTVSAIDLILFKVRSLFSF